MGSSTNASNGGRMRLRRRWIVTSLLAVVALAALPASAMASRQGAHGLRFKGSHQGAKTSSNLVDNGGRVLPSSDTYAIFWGPQSAWPSDTVSGIGTFFGGLGGSNYLSIAQQYMRGANVSSAYEGARTDSSAPPKQASASKLGAEVQKVYGTNLDPKGVYFVYTSNMPGGNFCAWHSFTTVSGQNIAVAYMPNTGGVAGCDPGNTYGLSGSETLRSLANVTAHEFMESITDAWPGNGTYGWIDPTGSEIGDKCAWQFTAPVKLKNGSNWQLQEEWSNAVTGCVQGQ